MKRSLLILFVPVMLGFALVTLLAAVAAAAPPAPGPPGIQINGLFWGDGDYAEYVFKSESLPATRGYIYAKAISPTQAAVLVRVGWGVNDNVFQRVADGYVQSVGWDIDLGAEKSEHKLKDLKGSDELTIVLECGDGKYEWTQDVLEGDKEDHNWTSPVKSFTTISGTAPAGGSFVIESHSSTEYNLLHSSWISVSQIISAGLTNAEDWMSPDLLPMGTISFTNPPDDINSMTQLHEDYPFFMSTGPAAGDLWEWSLNYEMLLDTTVCLGSQAYIGVSDAHSSPTKALPRDVYIITAIEVDDFSAGDSGGALLTVAAGGVLFLLVMTVLILRQANTKKS
jgi:hypothetical protein